MRHTLLISSDSSLSQCEMFHLFVLIFTVASASSHLDCFVDNQECDATAINTIFDVPSLDECTQLCDDKSNCNAFTHFDRKSLESPDVCLLFPSCRDRKPCENCTTGSSQTECTCSIGVAGEVAPENVVDFFGNVTEELACKRICMADIRCNLYTFHGDQDSVQPHICILLTSTGLDKDLFSCENCASGPGHCRVKETCQVAAFNNERSTFGNGVFAESNLSVTLEAREKDCFVDLDILAIGGGGNYGTGFTTSGAGSGYVKTAKVQVSVNNPALSVTVGSSGSPSKVELGGKVVLEAYSGGSPDFTRGGDGYSGGGGSDGYAWGGTDGGNGENGEDTPGGRGSGVDLRKIKMKGFVLTPGEGGRPWSAQGAGYGGGGGGVIVNGRKPGTDLHPSK